MNNPTYTRRATISMTEELYQTFKSKVDILNITGALAGAEAIIMFGVLAAIKNNDELPVYLEMSRDKE